MPVAVPLLDAVLVTVTADDGDDVSEAEEELVGDMLRVAVTELVLLGELVAVKEAVTLFVELDVVLGDALAVADPVAVLERVFVAVVVTELL